MGRKNVLPECHKKEKKRGGFIFDGKRVWPTFFRGKLRQDEPVIAAESGVLKSVGYGIGENTPSRGVWGREREADLGGNKKRKQEMFGRGEQGEGKGGFSKVSRKKRKDGNQG